jgi:Cys-tRNA(Pro) deacylase
VPKVSFSCGNARNIVCAAAAHTMSVTQAIHFLRANAVDFTEHSYRYEERGGTAASARELGVDEHVIIKTLVMEDEAKQPLIVLMHGDREVSTRNLARQTGRKCVTPCAPDVAQRHSGYLVGGTSPFGTRKRMPIYMERTVADLDRLYINGGRRGLLVALTSADLVRVLSPTLVDAAID